jgi:hypothetical protein
MLLPSIARSLVALIIIFPPFPLVLASAINKVFSLSPPPIFPLKEIEPAEISILPALPIAVSSD